MRENLESQRLQFDLAERVRSLGWSEVEVISSDLGASAAIGSASREGFERVLSSVALGEVGIEPHGPNKPCFLTASGTLPPAIPPEIFRSPSSLPTVTEPTTNSVEKGGPSCSSTALAGVHGS